MSAMFRWCAYMSWIARPLSRLKAASAMAFYYREVWLGADYYERLTEVKRMERDRDCRRLFAC